MEFYCIDFYLFFVTFVFLLYIFMNMSQFGNLSYWYFLPKLYWLWSPDEI